MALAVGSRARVHGLRNRADVNGHYVVVEAFIEASLRWGVHCEALSERLALKADNLESVHAPPPSPTEVSLIIQSSLLPHASNATALQALQAIGMHITRDAAPEITARLRSFPLTANDLLAYSIIGSKEPPAIAMLRMVCTLLVAPSRSLARLSTLGGASENGCFYRGSIGLALVAIVEHSMSRPEAAAHEYRSTLVRWRDAFAHRFGVPLHGSGPLALWARLQVRALLNAPSQMLPDEPEIAAVASCARAALTLSTGLHVERIWLAGASLARVRDAALLTLKQRHGRAAVLQGHASAVDLVGESLMSAGGVDSSSRACSCALSPQRCQRCSDGAGDLEGGDKSIGECFDGLPVPLVEVARLFERLRVELCVSTGRLLLECAQLLLLHFTGDAAEGRPISTDVTRLLRGGLLPRDQSHSGDCTHFGLRAARPSIAVLLLIPGDNSCAEADASGAFEVDTCHALHRVLPEAGTLILVDCASVERAAFLRRRQARACIACVLYEGSVQRLHNSGCVNLASLVLLERGSHDEADHGCVGDVEHCKEHHDEGTDASARMVSVNQSDQERQHALQALGLIDAYPLRPAALRHTPGGAFAKAYTDGPKVADNHAAEVSADTGIDRTAWRLLGLID